MFAVSFAKVENVDMNVGDFLNRFNATQREKTESKEESNDDDQSAPRLTGNSLLTLRDIDSDDEDQLEDVQLHATGIVGTQRSACGFRLKESHEAKGSFVSLGGEGNVSVLPQRASMKVGLVSQLLQARKRSRDESSTACQRASLRSLLLEKKGKLVQSPVVLVTENYLPSDLESEKMIDIDEFLGASETAPPVVDASDGIIAELLRSNKPKDVAPEAEPAPVIEEIPKKKHSVLEIARNMIKK